MNIEKDLKKYIVSRFLQGDGGKLTDDGSLFESGIIDSLGVLHLVAFLEERYGLHVEDEELIPENFETVNRIMDFVKSKQLSGQRA